VAAVACLLAGCASAEDANPGEHDFAVGGANDLSAPPDDLAQLDDGDGGTVNLGCPAAQHVLVNEVKTGGSASANDEFIEIYNPCGLAVDLTGFSIVYRSAAGSSDVVIINLTKVIGASSYLLVAGPNYTGTAT